MQAILNFNSGCDQVRCFVLDESSALHAAAYQTEVPNGLACMMHAT